jgi:hypothetical protein
MMMQDQGGMHPSERDRLVALEIKLAAFDEDLKAIRRVTDTLNAQSMYVRGALVLAVAVGGVLAWIGNVWSAFK